MSKVTHSQPQKRQCENEVWSSVSTKNDWIFHQNIIYLALFYVERIWILNESWCLDLLYEIP